MSNFTLLQDLATANTPEQSTLSEYVVYAIDEPAGSMKIGIPTNMVEAFDAFIIGADIDSIKENLTKFNAIDIVE